MECLSSAALLVRKMVSSIAISVALSACIAHTSAINWMPSDGLRWATRFYFFKMPDRAVDS
jgi:hypothetical protein